MNTSKNEPDHGGYLSVEHVTTAAAFNREMQYRSLPYRMTRLNARSKKDHGNWVLYEIRDEETLHEVPSMDEEYAVHIMRAWMYGMNHVQGIEIARRFLSGESVDDE